MRGERRDESRNVQTGVTAGRDQHFEQTICLVNVIETPDGPMHVQETVVLEPFCTQCGEAFIDCDCQWSDA